MENKPIKTLILQKPKKMSIREQKLKTKLIHMTIFFNRELRGLKHQLEKMEKFEETINNTIKMMYDSDSDSDNE
jgi:hypothetical protein